MVISGLLVNTVPEKMERIKNELSSMKGVEVNSVIDDYKIVVVVECGNVSEEVEISKQISKMDGVLGVNLAYHHFDEDETAK
ncbi:MAG: chaperone NapD [Nitrospirota bacterium]|nr:chaperone NapD [Nitrospirota bacterium]